MKFKKTLAVLSSAALMSTLCAQAASAAEAGEKTYKYVALGDSIAAGYALENPGTTPMEDRALIVTEELINDPVKAAYPTVFGNGEDYLKGLGEEYGYTTSSANLSMTAYRATDIAETFRTPGYQGKFAMILYTQMSDIPGAGEALAKYHDILMDYVPDADLISVQLGGNDIVMEIIYPMLGSENPVIRAAGFSLMYTLLGVDGEMAIGAGIQMIQEAYEKGEITYEVLAEAAAYFNDINEHSEDYVAAAAAHVSEVIDEVQKANTKADIALINMFNPYPTEVEIDEEGNDRRLNQYSEIVSNIFTEASEKLVGEFPAEQKVDAASADVTLVIESCDAYIDDYQSLIDEMDESSDEEIKAILQQIAQQIGVPVAFAMAGQNVDPQIKSLNAKLLEIASDKNCYYVDVYGITPEQNSDPHPTADGHKEIADRLFARMENVIRSRMSGSEIVDPEVEGDILVEFSPKAFSLKENGSKQLKLVVTYNDDDFAANAEDLADISSWELKSSDESIATVDASGVVYAHNEGQATITATNPDYVDDDGNMLTISCLVNVVSVFPDATNWNPTVGTPDQDHPGREAVSNNAVNITVNNSSSSNSPIAATGGELEAASENTAAVVASAVLGVIALGFVVVARKKRHS